MKILRSLTLVPFIFCALFSPIIEAKSSKKCKKAKADYVVIGMGTAGAVVAKKLTDDKRTSVIGLHIGENLTQDPIIKFSENAAITVGSALIGPPLYENGESVPQPNADNTEFTWAMALPEGGASSINAGAWARGTDQVYAQWEAIAGPNWSVKRILKIFKGLEKYKGETNNPAARGHHGPVDVFQEPNPSLLSQKLTQAIETATGLPFLLDYNDPLTPIGASTQVQFTEKGPNGILRVSSATAFLNQNVVTPDGRGVKGRKLRIFFNSTALRTIWEGNKAIGVEYLQNGETKKVYARKGVIVSAGLKSSFFLLHSGVGPKSLLESLNIPVVFDNPNVGQGLVDHVGLVTIFTSNPLDTDLFNFRLFSSISWLPTPGGDPNVRSFRYSAANSVPGIFVALLDLCQPLSRGSLTINSADPLVPPVIDLGYLSNPADLVLFRQGVQIYIKNIAAALEAMDPLYQLISPDPAILDDSTLVDDYIRNNLFCNQSFQSLCKMAPQNQGGVVDSSGAVYGVQNLFVADNSIVPQTMDGAPMASGYLIGANIARIIIKSDAKAKKAKRKRGSSL